MRYSNQYHFNLWLNQLMVDSTGSCKGQRKSKSKVKEGQTAPAIRREGPGAAGAYRSGSYPGIYAPTSWAASCKLELGCELEAGSCLT